MTEFPDANSGGLDPTGAAKPKVPLWKRVRAYAILIALYGAFLGMAAAAIPLLRSVFRPGVPLEDRGLNLMYGVALLIPLGIVLRHFVRVRIKTGRWRGTPEQRKEEREQRRATCSSATGCSPRKSPWSHYAVQWATCTAMDRTQPMPQRIAGWSVLALYGAWMLALVVISIVCFVMVFGVTDHPASMLIFLVGGLATLYWPVMAVVKLVRGVRAGKVGATREDVEQIRAQRTTQREREWQKPLRSKIISTVISCAIVAFLWIRVAIHSARHTHANWIEPALLTPALLYSIWVQFRRPKSVRTPSDGPATTEI
jgi:hypothetical protein